MCRSRASARSRSTCSSSRARRVLSPAAATPSTTGPTQPIEQLHVQLGRAAEDRSAGHRRRRARKAVHALPLPDLPPATGDAGRRDARDALRDHARGARLPERRAADQAGRQRQLRQQRRDHAQPGHAARRPAERPRQAPQIRPACRPAPAQAGRRIGPRAQRVQRGQRLGRRRHHRHHRRRPDADRTRLHRLRHGGWWPAHGALQARCADQPLLLDPVGPLRGAPRQGRHDRSGRVLPPGSRVQRRAHGQGDAGVAGAVQRTVLALPVPPGAHPRVPELRPLRAVVCQHHPVLGRHRLSDQARRRRTRSTSSPTSPRTRSRTSGGAISSCPATSRARPCWSRASRSTRRCW